MEIFKNIFNKIHKQKLKGKEQKNAPNSYRRERLK